MTPQERLKIDQTEGLRLSVQFEKLVALQSEPDVTVFLRRMGERLSSASPELKSSPLGVLLLKDRQGKWRNFGFPGNRVYLSVGLLKAVEFENELAAAIALELGHIQRRSLLLRVDRLRSEGVMPAQATTDSVAVGDFFSDAGLFSFDRDERMEAARVAVQLLYAAGYDPRGLAALIRRYKSETAKSPHAATMLEALERGIRTETALYSPLRNPIVRSDEFIRIQAKLRSLRE